jgi:hypothetical protein
MYTVTLYTSNKILRYPDDEWVESKHVAIKHNLQ